MISSRDAILRAICAEPDEDTPRLAFADLVEEEGEPERAAFIREQIALSRISAQDPLHIRAVQERPDAILGHSMAHTLPELPEGYSWHAFEFRRGFPWKVEITSPRALDPLQPSVFEIAPIQAIHLLAGPVPSLEQLADWPQLARIRRLEYLCGQFDKESCTRLGESPHADRLAELAIGYDGLTAAGLLALVRTPLFTRLEALTLRTNLIASELLVDALAAANEPKRLASLCLAANELEGTDAEQLFALPIMQGLHHLDLSFNPAFGAAGAKALARCRRTRSLRSLDLSHTHPGVPGMIELTRTFMLHGLRSLTLTANRLGPTAVDRLAESHLATGLRVLRLSENPIGDRGALAIATSAAFTGLQSLDLAETRIGDEGAIALVDSPFLSNLVRLDLSGKSTDPGFSVKTEQALRERFGAGLIRHVIES